jgi:hypothetical protein
MEFEVRVARVVRRWAYRAPENEWVGARTFVTEDAARGISPKDEGTPSQLPGQPVQSDRSRAAPQRPNTKENLTTYMESPAFNGPSSSTSNPKVPIRTPGKPGEEYGHPYRDGIFTRRASTGLIPSYSERQHRQQGEAKRYSQRYYRTHKTKINSDAKRRYRRVRNSPSFKREKALRNDSKMAPRFERLPAGGRRELASRVADIFYRETYRSGDPDRPPGPGAWDLGLPGPGSPSLPYPSDHTDRPSAQEALGRDHDPHAPGSARVLPPNFGTPRAAR